MSIIVTCSCGKQFKARSEFIGRRATCPKCGAALMIGPPPPPAPDPVVTSGGALDRMKVSEESNPVALAATTTSPAMKKAMILGGMVLALMLIASVTTAIVMLNSDGGDAHSSPKAITNSIGMTLVLIPPGDFVMGSPKTEYVDWPEYEAQHHVILTKGFYMSATEVTQSQWSAVMSNNPSQFKGDDLPVDRVTWEEAVAFCRKLSQMESRTYRLPTEAEWEYACRAGTTTAYCEGGTEADLSVVGWYSSYANGDIQKAPHPVGQKKPNPWGLFDMHGNVWEWCSDWFVARPLRNATDPKGPDYGTLRVLRGGSWANPPLGCRSAYRSRDKPDSRDYTNGFRVVMELSAESSDIPTTNSTLPHRTDVPAIISQSIDQGQLVSTTKMGLADGLFISISFVVLDPNTSEARKMNGMAGLVFIENLKTVKDYQFSRRSILTLVRDGRRLSLVQPQIENVNTWTVALDYSLFHAADLLAFLKAPGTFVVEVDGEYHDLSRLWGSHLVDLVNEVENQRKLMGYR